MSVRNCPVQRDHLSYKAALCLPVPTGWFLPWFLVQSSRAWPALLLAAQQRCNKLLFGVSPHGEYRAGCPILHLTLNLLLRRRKNTKHKTERPLPLPGIALAEVTGDHRLTQAGAGRGAPCQTAGANALCSVRRAQSPGALPDQYDLKDVIFLNLPLLSRPQPFLPLFSGWHFFPRLIFFHQNLVSSCWNHCIPDLYADQTLGTDAIVNFY